VQQKQNNSKGKRMIWRWLKAWKRRRRLNQRELLRFHDGEKIRRVDPFAVWRVIDSHPDWDPEIQGPKVDAWQEPETSVVVGIFSKAFGVKQFDPETNTGLSDREIIGIWLLLNEFISAVKKNSSRGQASPQPTDSASSSSTEPQSEATKA
tara:strand:- start:3008 stop:3460 length:453 start_codon:yes stop_codon:yes gene_type:complete